MGPPKQGIENFEGSAVQYTKFLEERVWFLEEQVRRLSSQVGHQHTVPFPSQPSTQCQSPVQQLSGSLVFHLETPESQTEKATKPSVELWKATTRKFVRLLPKDENGWSDGRTKVNLHKPEAISNTFCLFARHSPRVRSLEIGDAPSDEANILDVLGDYGGFANTLRTHRIYSKQVANYSTLLFVCLCVIALRAGSDLKVVDDYMRKFLTVQQGKECRSEKTYLSQLRTGALWVVKRMDELDKKGLKHRGPEMFVLCTFLNNIVANNS
jgi:hypothetical protein